MKGTHTHATSCYIAIILTADFCITYYIQYEYIHNVFEINKSFTVTMVLIFRYWKIVCKPIVMINVVALNPKAKICSTTRYLLGIIVFVTIIITLDLSHGLRF